VKAARITIALVRDDDQTLKAWLTMRVARREDQHIHFQVEVAPALAGDAVSFMHALSESQAKVLKADIVGGILLARRAIGRIGFSVELLSLGGCHGEERRVAALPSVGFGVAANLAVLHGLGIEDLARNPRGGFGWRMESFSAVADEIGGS
jgi:hypothetical protein